MGMGGAQGPRGDKNRRLVAWVVVIALVMGAAATLLSIALL
jgi:hypothetical protein